MSEVKRISLEEYREDPGKWLRRSRDQQVAVVGESGRVEIVIGITGAELFPDPPEDDDWWEDYEVDDDYEHDPNSWLR